LLGEDPSDDAADLRLGGGRGPPNGFCAISACKAASKTMTAANAAAVIAMPRARPADINLTGNSP
jgi:hypothetical protein